MPAVIPGRVAMGSRSARNPFQFLVGKGRLGLLEFLCGNRIPDRLGHGHDGLSIARLAQFLLEGGVLADGFEEFLEIFLGHDSWVLEGGWQPGDCARPRTQVFNKGGITLINWVGGVSGCTRVDPGQPPPEEIRGFVGRR